MVGVGWKLIALVGAQKLIGETSILPGSRGVACLDVVVDFVSCWQPRSWWSVGDAALGHSPRRESVSALSDRRPLINWPASDEPARLGPNQAR